MPQKLYLMRSCHGLYKIGISYVPKKRRREIENSSGLDVELVREWECINARETEQSLHKHFYEFRRNGEWFEFSSDPSLEIEKFITTELSVEDILLECAHGLESHDSVCVLIDSRFSGWDLVEMLQNRHGIDAILDDSIESTQIRNNHELFSLLFNCKRNQDLPESGIIAVKSELYASWLEEKMPVVRCSAM